MSRKHRHRYVLALSVTGLAISIWMFTQVPSGRLAFLLCALGAAGVLYRESAPRARSQAQ